jgi:hypothetical protein
MARTIIGETKRERQRKGKDEQLAWTKQEGES